MWASVHPPQCSSVFWELPGSKEARLPLGGERVHHLEMLLLLNPRGNAVSSCCCSLFHWLKLAPSGFPAKGSPQNKALCDQDQSHSQMLLTLLMCHLSAPILEFLSSHEHARSPRQWREPADKPTGVATQMPPGSESFTTQSPPVKKEPGSKGVLGVLEPCPPCRSCCHSL